MTPTAMMPNHVSHCIQKGFWNGVLLSYGFGPGSLGSRICGFKSFMAFPLFDPANIMAIRH